MSFRERDYLLDGLPWRNRMWAKYGHRFALLVSHRYGRKHPKWGEWLLKLGRFVPTPQDVPPKRIRDDIVRVKTVTLNPPREGHAIESRSMADVIKQHTDRGRFPYVINEDADARADHPSREKFTKQFPLSQ